MRAIGVSFLVGALLTFAGYCQAQELTFPKTEREIVDALSLKDGQIEHNGQTYVSENGKVYRMIRGRRFRMRGLEEIVDSALTPRAGAIIEFSYGKAAIDPKYYPLLNEFGKALTRELSGANLIVAGHTCDLGTDEFNMRLSEKRAQAVKEYLEKHHGVAARRLAIRAYGKTKPIAPNDTEDGRHLNRRVEFIRTDAM
jgi:outer membrane protein OmpA-like peptidoglycan-associated protein